MFRAYISANVDHFVKKHYQVINHSMQKEFFIYIWNINKQEMYIFQKGRAYSMKRGIDWCAWFVGITPSLGVRNTGLFYETVWFDAQRRLSHWRSHRLANNDNVATVTIAIVSAALPLPLQRHVLVQQSLWQLFQPCNIPMTTNLLWFFSNTLLCCC